MHWWETYPWRMIQTNLREIDMEDMDAKAYARDLKEFGATVVTLNAGGILASYDTELSEHRKSEYLHGDSLQTIVEECHKAGIKVIARMDFSKVHPEVYEKHPEWAYRTAEGDIVTDSGYVHTCINSGYQQEYVLEILKETLTKIPFDGVFCNMSSVVAMDYKGNFYGPCHCETCKRLYREKYGEDIPGKEDMHKPAFMKYMAFLSERSGMQKRRQCEVIHEISPEIAVNGFDYTRTESNTDIGVEKWVYSASSNSRKIRGPKRTRVVDNAAVDFMGARYRDSSISPAQMELRQWQNLANAGAVSLYIMGRLDNHRDRSCFEGTRKVFQFHKEHEELYTGVQSAAEVLLLHKNAMARFEEETYGWIRALTESHIPFDEMRLADLKQPEQLADKKLAILCDAASLNTVQVQLLDHFAENGGTVLATGDIGMFRPGNRPQEKPALQCMGVKRILEKKKNRMSSVFEVKEEEKSCFPHCADAPYIAPGAELITAEFEEGTVKYLKLIGEHPFGPPEVCYYTEKDVTDHPGVTVYHYGKGKGVYMPWKAGAFYFTEGYQNTLNVMQDVLFKLCGTVQIAPGLTPMVEVHLSKKDGMTIVQLVNTSGAFANSFFAPLPVYDIRIELEGLSASDVKAYNGGTVSCKEEDGKLILKLDKLEAYEIITVEA